MRQSILGMLSWIIIVLFSSSCDCRLLDPDRGDVATPDSLSLKWWFVSGWDMESQIGACDRQYDQLQKGDTNYDTRLWSVGSWLSVSPHFAGECADPQGLSCSGPVFEIETADSAVLRPHGENDSLLFVEGAGLGEIFATAYDRPWGPLRMRTAEPGGFFVTRLTFDEYEEPLEGVALAASGSLRIVIRVLDRTAHHLCGRPSMDVMGHGVRAYADSLRNPEMAGNGVLVLQAVDSAETVSVELSIGDARTTLDFDLVEPSALTDVHATLTEGVLQHWVRLRALAGEQEVAGAKLSIENLTPELYSIADSDHETEIHTRRPAVVLVPNDNGLSGTARMSITLVGSAVPPKIFEFSVS